MSTDVRAARLAHAPLVLVAAAFFLIAFGLVAGTLRVSAALAMLLLGIAALVAKPVLEWRGLVVGLLLIILFVPIRRYVLPGGMPFQLEPYRLYVMLLVGGWALSLLVDRRVSVKRTGFEGPLLCLVGVTIASELVNPAHVGSLATPVLKSLTFFMSFIFVVYLLASVIRTQSDVELTVRTLVMGGAIISAAAIVESRTGFNIFDHLNRFLPFLRSTVETSLGREGHSRAFGPAQHPIALGAALTMLVPLAVYVAATSRSRWWHFTSMLLILGAFATISRTSIVMLFVVLMFFLWLHPRETRRLWPLAVPLIVATHFFLPGTLGTLGAYFHPSGGIVQQQTQVHIPVDRSNPLWCNIAPRLARVGPMLTEASHHPILGQGYGTRITDGPAANTCVLDDQWLGTLLETGVAGLLAWWWLIIAFVRRTMRVARREDSPRARLLGALGTAVASLGVGMFLFDALSFIQVAFLLFIYLALGAIVLRGNEDVSRAAAAAPSLRPTPFRKLPSQLTTAPTGRGQT